MYIILQNSFKTTYMHFLKNLIITSVGFLLITSCSQTDYKFKLNSKEKVTLGEEAVITLEQIEGEKADSIQLYINTTKLNSDKTQVINTNNLGTGKHHITALAFFPEKVKKIKKTIEVVSNKKYDVYTCEIINTYPHDPKAYTQGLEYHNGYLYETTGRKGESWLRKIDLETGEILQQKDLSDTYFGEGMTIFNNEISWLTWQAGKGFTYSIDDFSKTGEFGYQKSFEGWGLTHSENELIKSDGTNKIWFLDPETKKEKRSIQAYAKDTPVDNLNELEYIDGKIYANYWNTGDGKNVKSTIAIINPTNGIVEGLVNLNNVRQEVLKGQKLEADDVLNGIAYDAKTNRLFVTGKHWNKLFEVRLIKKN